ncbi:MAG: hypothetical protein K0R82_1488 [Flavipsychrobacter sp.]|nr:hypothetical protein [Flavipsychrobacter sp.]
MTDFNRKGIGEEHLFTPGITREQAVSFGRSLRNKTDRLSHARWLVPKDRPDPVAVLMKANEGLLSILLPVRYSSMLESPLNFFRGSAAIMAADMATTPDTGLYVQSCGDCHLMNFGIYRTQEKKMVFDIIDFDETLPAPWEWDVKRLATSFVIASVQNQINRQTVAVIAHECVRSYREHIAAFAGMDPLQVWYSCFSVKSILRMAKDHELSARFAKRVRKAITKSLIGEDFHRLTEMRDDKIQLKNDSVLSQHDYRKLIEAVFESYVDTLSYEERILFDQFKFRDIAAKVGSIGSIGTLNGISLRMSPNEEPLFLQIKEARPSVLEPFVGKSRYNNNGQRVVAGQKLMQAAGDVFLGWTEIANGRHFYIRQMREARIEPKIAAFNARVMIRYAQLCGGALARAHARNFKSSIISGYLGSCSKFDDAVSQFAIEYAEQNRKDYEALQDAVKKGLVVANKFPSQNGAPKTDKPAYDTVDQ